MATEGRLAKGSQSVGWRRIGLLLLTLLVSELIYSSCAIHSSSVVNTEVGRRTSGGKQRDGDRDESGIRAEEAVEEQATACVPGTKLGHDLLLGAYDLERSDVCDEK